MPNERFTVKIDYSLTLEQKILACRYDHVGPFLRNNEPVQGGLQGDGIATVNLVLVHIAVQVSTDKALLIIQKQGLVSAGIEHLLALSLEQPDLQRQIYILALGSVWQRAKDGLKDDLAVPFIWGDSQCRCLSLHCIWLNWPEKYYRFLAVQSDMNV